MKKFVIIATVLTAMLSFASCGNATENAPAVEQIASAGHTNTVVTEAPVDTEPDEPEESIPEESSSREQDSSALDTDSTAEKSSDSSDTYVLKTESAAGKSDNTAAKTESTAPNSDNAAAPVENENVQVTGQPTYDEPAVDPEDMRDQIFGSVEGLNEMFVIAQGSCAHMADAYDSDLEPTEDHEKTAYYAIPEDYAEKIRNFGMLLHEGPYTGNFISTMGFENSTDIYFEHDGRMLVAKENFVLRPNYFIVEDNTIYTEEEPGKCYIYVSNLLPYRKFIYKLSFVYESVITADTYMWKIDSLTEVE